MTGLLMGALLLVVATDTPEQTAARFLDRCRQGQYEQAVELFDTSVATALPATKLKQAWESITGAYGPLKPVAFGPARVEPEGAASVVMVRCEFTRQALDARLAVREGK